MASLGEVGFGDIMKNMSLMQNKQRGFTIVELLIVIVVIATLAAITIVAYNGIQQRARDSQRKSDIATIQKALEMYHIDNGGYPACSNAAYVPGESRGSCSPTNQGFVAALVPRYLNEIPDDPLGNAQSYKYLYGSKKSTDILYSASFDDNYIIGVGYESQSGPYSTQMAAGVYNYIFGSNN